MKYLRFLAVGVMIFSGLFGCSGSDDRGQTNAVSYQSLLQSSVDANWNTYKSEHGLPNGGLNVYVETPTGTYFAASGMPTGTGVDTRFRIASNTKSFTCAAIMLLYQQGKLRIDDTIVTSIPDQVIPYVPNTPAYNIPHKSTITIKQLMNHTAGVYDVTNEVMPNDCPALYAGKNYWFYITQDLGQTAHQFTPEELITPNAVCQATYGEPGAGYNYSNTGYSLLAVIIERVSGIPYDQFITRNLIAPNSLTATTVPVLASDTAIPAPYADGYYFIDSTLRMVTDSNMSANIAEGNIISTPKDLARWLRRLIRSEAGPTVASVNLMKEVSPQSGGAYGFGIQYVNGLGYGHAGAHEGYLSVMAYDPVTDVTVVAYNNIWDYANLETIQAQTLVKSALDAKKAVGY